MRTATLAKVYAATYLSEIWHGVPVGGYTNLRELRMNIQTDYSELDLQTYGQTVNEIIKLRADTLPDIAKGDFLYLTKPSVQGTFEIDGQTYEDYGMGDYQIKSIRPTYVGVRTVRNPTLVEARKTTEGEENGGENTGNA